MLQKSSSEIGVLDFAEFEFIWAAVCLGFRYSNFGFSLVWRLGGNIIRTQK